MKLLTQKYTTWPTPAGLGFGPSPGAILTATFRHGGMTVTFHSSLTLEVPIERLTSH